jgi:hypothetical protein
LSYRKQYDYDKPEIELELQFDFREFIPEAVSNCYSEPESCTERRTGQQIVKKRLS